MKNYLKHIIISGLMICLFSQLAFAQDSTAWKDLQKIFKAYSIPIAFKGDMKLYAANDTSHVLEDLHVRFIMANKNLDYVLSYVEIIRTPKYFLTINNHYKTILITQAKKASSKTALFDFNALKKLLKTHSVKITADKTGKEYSVLITLPNNPQIKSYHIYYSPETYRIAHLFIKLWDENDPGNTRKMKVLKVHYSGYRKPDLAENNFFEKKILTVQGSRIIPNKKYKSYQIISQL